MLFPWSNNLPNAPRLFAPSQLEVNLFQSLPYTLALRTMRAQSSSAMNRRRGTRNTRLSLRESTKCFTPKPWDNISVPGGSDVKNVQTGTTTPTSAQDAALPLMELTTVLRCRGLWVQTPYEPNAWKQVLVLADPDRCFHSIPDGLRFGFIIDFPNISSIQSPPNSSSVLNVLKSGSVRFLLPFLKQLDQDWS